MYPWTRVGVKPEGSKHTFWPYRGRSSVHARTWRSLKNTMLRKLPVTENKMQGFSLEGEIRLLKSYVGWDCGEGGQQGGKRGRGRV